MTIQKSTKNFYAVTGNYLNNTSELNLFNILTDTVTKEYFLNIFRNYVINDSASSNIVYYLTHEIDNAEYPDTISQMYYGTPFLWWVIGCFNGITNPFEEFDAGSNLKILKPDYIYQLMKEISLVGGM